MRSLLSLVNHQEKTILSFPICETSYGLGFSPDRSRVLFSHGKSADSGLQFWLIDAQQGGAREIPDGADLSPDAAWMLMRNRTPGQKLYRAGLTVIATGSNESHPVTDLGAFPL